MKFDFLEELQQNIEKKIEKEHKRYREKENTSDLEKEVAHKLDAIEEFTVDRIEESYVVLENCLTKQMENRKKEELPSEIQEGDILQKIHGKYRIDQEKTRQIEKNIEDKMKNLWE